MKQRYKKPVIYLSLLIMGIGMLTFPIDYPGSKHSPADDSTEVSQEKVPFSSAIGATTTPCPTPTLIPVSDTPTPSATPSPTDIVRATPAPGEYPLLDEVPDSIIRLVNQRYKALLSDSIEDYSNLLYGSDSINLDTVLKQADYIQDYQNIRCYAKQPSGIVDYVVYVRYDAALVSIDTPVPSLDEFLIRFNENGQPLIYLADALNEEEKVFIAQLRQDEDVKLLTEEVTKELEAALLKDSALKEFIMKLNN